MPLDNADFIPDDYQKLLHLARKLRARDFGFIWDYTHCNTCAIELAKTMFGRGAYEANFGLSGNDYQQVFIRAGYASNKFMWDVQPEDVAGVIEQVVEAKVYA